MKQKNLSGEEFLKEIGEILRFKDLEISISGLGEVGKEVAHQIYSIGDQAGGKIKTIHLFTEQIARAMNLKRELTGLKDGDKIKIHQRSELEDIASDLDISGNLKS